MTKEEYLALAESRYDELEALKKHDNFYDYEKGLVEILQELGRDYLMQSLNETSKTNNRRKKKLSPDLER